MFTQRHYHQLYDILVEELFQYKGGGTFHISMHSWNKGKPPK